MKFDGMTYKEASHLYGPCHDYNTRKLHCQKLQLYLLTLVETLVTKKKSQNTQTCEEIACSHFLSQYDDWGFKKRRNPTALLGT